MPKRLAESIILQCIEDLWDERHRQESIAFFTGPDFKFMAKSAGMHAEQKIELLHLIKRISAYSGGIIPKADRAGTSPRALSAPP